MNREDRLEITRSAIGTPYSDDVFNGAAWVDVTEDRVSVAYRNHDTDEYDQWTYRLVPVVQAWTEEA